MSLQEELIVRTSNESHQSRPNVRQRRTNKSFYSSSGSQGKYPPLWRGKGKNKGHEVSILPQGVKKKGHIMEDMRSLYCLRMSRKRGTSWRDSENVGHESLYYLRVLRKRGKSWRGRENEGHDSLYCIRVSRKRGSSWRKKVV